VTSEAASSRATEPPSECLQTRAESRAAARRGLARPWRAAARAQRELKRRRPPPPFVGVAAAVLLVVRGRVSARSHRPSPRARVHITCYVKSRALMKTRAGIKDETGGRVTSWPSLPTCWSRDRSSPHRGATPPGAACPRAKAPGGRIMARPLSGAATAGSGANRPGTRRAACRHSHPLAAAVQHGVCRARRPRADLARGPTARSHKPARPRLGERPLGSRGARTSWPSRATRRQRTLWVVAAGRRVDRALPPVVAILQGPGTPWGTPRFS